MSMKIQPESVAVTLSNSCRLRRDWGDERDGAKREGNVLFRIDSEYAARKHARTNGASCIVNSDGTALMFYTVGCSLSRRLYRVSRIHTAA